MPSPQAVKDAAKKADEMILALAKGEPQASAEPLAVPPETPEPMQPTQPEPLPSAPALQNPQAAPTSGPDPVVATLTEKLAKLEQQYKSLQGMFAAKNNQVEQLTELLAEMTQAPPQPQQPETKAERKRRVTAEDEEAYGADLIDFSSRVAQDILDEQVSKFEARVAQLEAENNSLKQQVGGVTKEAAITAQERFVKSLRTGLKESANADFDTINMDPKFEEWIKSSPSRFKLFSTAVGERDMPGTLNFYELYAIQTVAKAVKPDAPTKQDPRLERQVMPGKSNSPAPAANADQGAKKQWTRSEIAEFYRNKAKLSKDEAAALERDIFAAQSQGRVDFTK
jgi:prefoldin subunit 5